MPFFCKRLSVVQDGGDPKVKVPVRDIVYALTAEAAKNNSEPTVLATTEFR